MKTLLALALVAMTSTAALAQTASVAPAAPAPSTSPEAVMMADGLYHPNMQKKQSTDGGVGISSGSPATQKAIYDNFYNYGGDPRLQVQSNGGGGE